MELELLTNGGKRFEEQFRRSTVQKVTTKVEYTVGRDDVAIYKGWEMRREGTWSKSRR